MIRGALRGSKSSMITLVVGPVESAHQFADIAYSGNTVVHNVASLFSWQLDPSELPKADVTVVAGRQNTRKLAENGFILLPWVDFGMSLSKSMVSLEEQFSRRRKRDSRKIRHRDYSYKVSRRDPEALNFFYQKMYCPYVMWRFGRAAFVEAYSNLRACYERNGGIVWVNHGEQPIAGLAFQARGETLRALALGADMNCVSSERYLAGRAALLFLVDWGKRNGLKWLDYGVTLPFLRDGLFQYKREWGMVAKAKSDRTFCVLRIDKVNEATLSFLQQHPFVTLDGGRSTGVILVGHKLSAEELKKRVSRHQVSGIDSLVGVAFFKDPLGRRGAKSPLTQDRISKTSPSFISAICEALGRKGFAIEVTEYTTPSRK
jgi:hypothetical protein